MNARDLFLLLTQGTIVYFLLSTLLIDASFVGSFGSDIGKLSRYAFGALSFLFYGALFFGVYRFYHDRTFSARRQELMVASTLLYFTLLIFQSLIIPAGEWNGAFGTSFIAFIQPYIGFFGVWIFWIVASTVSLIILRDITLPELAFIIKQKKFLTKKEPQTEPEVSTPKQEEIVKLPSNTEETVHETASVSLGEKLENILPEEGESDFEIRRVAHKDTIEKPHEEYEDESEILDTFIYEITQHDEKKREQTNSIHEESVTEENIPEQISSKREEFHAEVVEELEENKKLLEALEKGKKPIKPTNFTLPPLSILQEPSRQTKQQNEGFLDIKIKNLIEKLAKFKIEGDVIRTYTGPVVSTFEFKPAAHIKVSKILSLQDDLAMALKAQTIRIQAPIPGKDVVGIEIPNDEIDTIYLRDILESDVFNNSSSELTLALGQDIVGKPFVTDLKKLPHLLIAGTTGSGKSVGINAMILSLLYRNSPDQLRIIMIDPKMLEFSIYNDIPHLLTPVITQAKQAIVALNNMVAEMERRYKLMSENRTKNIDNFNERMKRIGKDTLPYIVVVIDELADLMMTSGKEVEYSIGRLAQMARASGIHLIVATQRPSVDVVTGLIKANLPSRISYRVGQKVDSKVILDSMGAESLLGRGDMLFTPPGMTGLVRLHAPWSSEEEIERVSDFLRNQRKVEYDQRFLSAPEGSSNGDIIVEGDLDPLYDEAKEIIMSDKKTSISYLQRKLQIGYNRSARVIEQLESMGVLSEPNSKGNREIL